MRVSYIGNYINHKPNGETLNSLKADDMLAFSDEELDSLPQFDLIPAGLILVVVVNNGPWDAAMVCDNEHDYGRVHRSINRGDKRPVRFFLIKREWVAQMSDNKLESDGYKRGEAK